jgi:competence protein ComEC
MEEYLIRSGDVAFGLAAVFLFGALAATYGWDIDVIFLCLCAVAAAAVFYFPVLRSRALGALIAFALFIFPLSVFYYHVRVPPMTGSPSFVAPAAVNPVFTRIVAIFGNTLPYRQASLLAGMVTGSTTVLAPDVKIAMSQSGTSYIIGMYGYKIYLLAETVRAACKRFLSRRLASLLVIVALSIFIAAANAPISALRAGIMAGLAMFAETFGRKFNTRNALIFTAALMVFFDPAVLGSGGFLLSFMSLVGIYALAPSFKALLNIDRSGNGALAWRSNLATTTAVNLAIMPIVSMLYGEFPAISFVSNFFIALPFGALIAMGIALATIGSIFTATTVLITPVLDLLLSYQLLVIRIFSGLAWSVPALFSSPVAIIAYYSVLGWLAFYCTSHAHHE